MSSKTRQQNLYPVITLLPWQEGFWHQCWNEPYLDRVPSFNEFRGGRRGRGGGMDRGGINRRRGLTRTFSNVQVQVHDGDLDTLLDDVADEEEFMEGEDFDYDS